MIEALVKIANVFTIILILGFAGYLWSTLKEMKYHLLGALIQWRVYKNKEQICWIIRSPYLNVYCVVPALLVTNLILISQFANETYRIRLDFQFFINILIWFFLFRLFKTQHDINCRLKEKLELEKKHATNPPEM